MWAMDGTETACAEVGSEMIATGIVAALENLLFPYLPPAVVMGYIRPCQGIVNFLVVFQSVGVDNTGCH
jgi:hypothetical protein